MKIIEEFPIPEMVEKVARAMWLQRCAHTMRTAGIELEAWGEDGAIPLANGIIEEARAAIDAMREPTKPMIWAAYEEDRTKSAADDSNIDFAAGCWRAMIDAALS